MSLSPSYIRRKLAVEPSREIEGLLRRAECQIAIQAEGSEVEFRKVELKKLG